MIPFPQATARGRLISTLAWFVFLALGTSAACNLTDPVSRNTDAGPNDTATDTHCEAWVVSDASGEACDGTDNDCDGVVDEGCSCEFEGTSEGVCANAVRGEDGDCSEPDAWEADETSCDGLDNDCDGVTDEDCDCNYDGTSRGVCSDSTRNDDGSCAEPDLWQAQETACDDVDNDCDGEVDENCTCEPGQVEDCYGGPQGTEGVGICTDGSRECGDDGTWTSCSGATLPEDETCGDSTDNDCDGVIDEDCSCNYDDTSTGVCGDASVGPDGSCQQPSSYESTESSCGDGADNDCDGSADLDDPDCKRAAGANCSADGDCISNICDGGACAHRLFVTSSTVGGDFGGLSAADATCQNTASNAGLAGTWKAIVSVQGTSAKSRLQIRGPIYNMNGQKFADDESSLWSSSHPNPPKFDENRNAIDGSTWTGTDFRGDTTSDRNCEDWTSGSSNKEGAIGWTDASDNAWIHAGGFAKPCSDAYHLYCIDGQ